MSLSSLCSQHTIAHYRITRVSGDYGGGKPTRTSLGAKMCRIQPRSGSEDDKFESPDERITHAVYFNNDPLADARDQFDYSFGASGLNTLEVQNVINFNELNRVWRVDCIELKKKGR